MKTAIQALHPATLSLVLAAALTGCGGDSSSSPRPSAQITDDNAARVVQAVFGLSTMLPQLAMTVPSMLGSADEDSCQNSGTLSFNGSFSQPPAPGDTIAVTANDCLIGTNPDFLLNGSLSVSADLASQGSPDSLVFTYTHFSINVSDASETASMTSTVSLNGSLPLENMFNTPSIRQANIRLAAEGTMIEEGTSRSEKLTIQTTNFDAFYSDESGLGMLSTFSGGLHILAPLNIKLNVITHEEADIEDCEAGDLTIEATNSSVNVRFSGGSAIVTTNGVQQMADDCGAFHDWLYQNPLLNQPR